MLPAGHRQEAAFTQHEQSLETAAYRGAELEVRIQMGWTPSATAEPGSDTIGGTELSFNERSP